MNSAKISSVEKSEQLHELTSSELTSVAGGSLILLVNIGFGWVIGNAIGDDPLGLERGVLRGLRG
jgi:hypothetical protein